MKIYNREKTNILEQVDYSLGYTKADFIIKQIPEVSAVERVFHYEVIREYPETGGKDLKEVVDVEGVEYQPAREEKENILIYIPYTETELEERELRSLRVRRKEECFSIINRGQFWYDTLTETQKEELKEWYQAWLDITDTLIVPEEPSWIN